MFVGHPDEGLKGVTVTRADLLAALPELGVIVIDKAELPPVTKNGRAREVAGVNGYLDLEIAEHDTPESLRAAAFAHLALAAHLEANLPVDPKVTALASVLASTFPPDHIVSSLTDDDLAKILATGRVEVTS